MEKNKKMRFCGTKLGEKTIFLMQKHLLQLKKL